MSGITCHLQLGESGTIVWENTLLPSYPSFVNVARVNASSVIVLTGNKFSNLGLLPMYQTFQRWLEYSGPGNQSRAYDSLACYSSLGVQEAYRARYQWSHSHLLNKTGKRFSWYSHRCCSYLSRIAQAYDACFVFISQHNGVNILSCTVQGCWKIGQLIRVAHSLLDSSSPWL